jgi:hypothetical protein
MTSLVNRHAVRGLRMAEVAALHHRQQMLEPTDMGVEIDELVINLIWRAAEPHAEIAKILCRTGGRIDRSSTTPHRSRGPGRRRVSSQHRCTDRSG